MMIHEITVQVGAKRRRKRVGRGEASGLGKTSGRGHKGAGSRSGWSYNAAFEGGQIPFARRIPKRGFSNVNFAQQFHVVNLKALEALCDEGADVDVALLAKLGLVRDVSRPLKVLGEGDLKKRLTVTATKFSASAKAKIEAAGGTVVERPIVKWKRDNSKPGLKAQARTKGQAGGGGEAGGTSKGKSKADSATKSQPRSKPDTAGTEASAD